MGIPSELFKYRDVEKYTILSLLNCGLWLPKPSQLNDPFDAQLKLVMDGVSKSARKKPSLATLGFVNFR